MAFINLLGLFCVGSLLLQIKGVYSQKLCFNGLPEETAAINRYGKNRGLLGRYYPALKFTAGIPVEFPPPNAALSFQGIDSSINLNTRDRVTTTHLGEVAETMGNKRFVDHLVVRWSGKVIIPCEGDYIFKISGDDGMAMKIDGDIEISDWSKHSTKHSYTPVIYMQANTLHTIEYDFFESGGNAVAKLSWLRPGSQDYELVPTEYLIPSISPQILIFPSVIAFSTASQQTINIRLSEKPLTEVTISIKNLVGLDEFGFDVCSLTFTPENWDIDQQLRVKLNPLSATVRKGTVRVFLESSSKDPNFDLLPNALQILTPGNGNDPQRCTAYGDVHYRSLDGVKFNFNEVGYYHLARTCSQSFDVQSVLAPCGSGAKVTCQQKIFMRYGDSVFVSYLSDDSGDVDLNAGLLSGTGEGVVVSNSNTKNTKWTTSSGIEINIRVGKYKDWRFLDVNVITPSHLSGLMAGLCGNGNYEINDDDTDSISLKSSWKVEVNNQLDVQPLQKTTDLTCTGIQPEEGRVDFLMDPRCSYSIPPTIVDPSTIPSNDVPVIALDSDVSGKEIINATLLAAYKKSCGVLIASLECPASITPAESNPYKDSCAFDAYHVSPDEFVALDIANDLAIVGAFKDYCDFREALDLSKKCSICTPQQKCVDGECVAAITPCYPGCQNGGSCSEDVCTCFDGFTGPLCDILPADYDPCLLQPCNNGECIRGQNTEYVCKCDLHYGGSLCTEFTCPTKEAEAIEFVGVEGDMAGCGWMHFNFKAHVDVTEFAMFEVDLTGPATLFYPSRRTFASFSDSVSLSAGEKDFAAVYFKLDDMELMTVFDFTFQVDFKIVGSDCPRKQIFRTTIYTSSVTQFCNFDECSLALLATHVEDHKWIETTWSSPFPITDFKLYASSFPLNLDIDISYPRFRPYTSFYNSLQMDTFFRDFATFKMDLKDDKYTQFFQTNNFTSFNLTMSFQVFGKLCERQDFITLPSRAFDPLNELYDGNGELDLANCRTYHKNIELIPFHLTFSKILGNWIILHVRANVSINNFKLTAKSRSLKTVSYGSTNEHASFENGNGLRGPVLDTHRLCSNCPREDTVAFYVANEDLEDTYDLIITFTSLGASYCFQHTMDISKD